MNEAPSPPRRSAPRLEAYPHRTNDTIRYADLDPQGHVNNAVFATYFETGRVAMFRLPDLSIGTNGLTLVLVRTEIDFLHELRWPGTVEIGSALANFGRTSFTMAQAVFRDGICAAAGRAIMVCIDQGERRPKPLPDDLVVRLARWKFRGE